jgi:adenylylsulfate kinase
MHKDSKSRTMLKTITWRITATSTTTILVYIFTGKIDTAIEVGMLEMLAKMLFYYMHERGWEKLKWGKKDVPSFVLWISGIPRSGKTTLGNMIFDNLKDESLKIQRLDSHDVRPLFPGTGFARDEVDNHIKRVGHLASMLEKNGVITIASFVSPYKESRKFVRNLCDNYVEVYLKTSVEKARQYDDYRFYDRAETGEIKNVPGVDVKYETCENTELEIDMHNKSLEEARDEIIEILKSRYFKN